MTTTAKRKSTLLHSCGGAALAVGTMLVSSQASAQAIQATPSVVQGSAVIDSTTPDQDTITIVGLDAVIDWTPDEISGSALTFLPSTGTVTFQGGPGDPIFGVINRILPSANGDVAVIDGAVISQLRDSGGSPIGPGGFVAFYSSTGLLIGDNASFDIGGLLLTTLDPDIGSFTQFVTGGGAINMTGVSNDSSSVQIDPGAEINGTGEGSALAVVAPQILMSGTVDMNGSVAYIAAEQVNLSYSNGLFDIVIPTGTNVSAALLHDGITGGPSSQGASDPHMIYGAVQAQQNPITAIFSGNLGFQPALNATIDNGTILLSGNYHVFGASVNNDFSQQTTTSTTPVDLILENATVTSDIEMHSTHFAQAIAIGGVTDITGDLFLYGHQDAQMIASFDSLFQVVGDVIVSSTVRGNSIPGAGDLFLLAANAGIAVIGAEQGGLIDITGDVTVEADAIPGIDSSLQLVGDANAGVADIFSETSIIDITGNVFMSATADINGSNQPFSVSGDATGGSVSIEASFDGSVSISGGVIAQAEALANPIGDSFGTPGFATGGEVFLYSDEGTLSDLFIGGDVLLSANAFGAQSSSSNSELATGGSVGALVDNGSTITIDQTLIAQADAYGGEVVAGTGGDAISGDATLTSLNSGTLTISGLTTLSSSAYGGDGQTGGAAGGRSVGVAVDIGGSAIFGGMDLLSYVEGGAGSIGAGGDATGGVAQMDAAGSGLLTMGGLVELTTTSIGGTGGSAGGSALAGVVSLTSDGGTISAPSAIVSLLSEAIGGNAGLNGGVGGDATGALASVAAQNAGTMDIGGLEVFSEVVGGTGTRAEGGDADGGTVSLIADDSGSDINIGTLTQPLFISGAEGGVSNGGSGIGGAAFGGSVNVAVGNLAQLTFPTILGTIDQQAAIGTFTHGGDSSLDSGAGGDATAGFVNFAVSGGGIFDGTTLQILNETEGGSSLNSAFVIDGGNALNGTQSQLVVIGSLFNAELLTSNSSYGGNTDNGIAGDAEAPGFSINGSSNGAINLLGDSSVLVEAIGGNGPTGGNADASSANITLSGGASLNLTASTANSLTVTTYAEGGTGDNIGGNATAGQVSASASNATIIGANLFLNSLATAGIANLGISGAGTAIANSALLASLTGGTIDLDLVDISSVATSFAGGSSSSGLVGVDAQNAGSTFDGFTVNLLSSAVDGDTNSAGPLLVRSLNGSTMTLHDLTGVAANSDDAPDTGVSFLAADNGQIRITNTADLSVTSDLHVVTGNTGTIVGGADANNLSASFLLETFGLLNIAGDDDNLTSFGALDMTLISNDIQISPTARFGAPTLTFISTNLSGAAVLGDGITGSAYTMTQAETAQIEGDFITFFGAGDTASTSYDVILGDLTAFGTFLGNGVSQLSIISDGSLGVLGAVRFTDAGSSDFLNIEAAGRLEIQLDSGGGILMDDGATVPELAGTLRLYGQQIFAAGSDGLAIIDSDPDDPALAVSLADDGGSTITQNYEARSHRTTLPQMVC